MDAEEDHDFQHAARSVVVLTPGSTVSAPTSFLRGHGTYTQGDGLAASVAGVVERVNKLVTVRAPKARFAGAVGDVVVGRITEVGNKRWKVDINSRQDAVLLLGSINLPGGAQRRRTLEDQLQMRQLFAENDMISAEVSSFYKDGGVALQTRSLKYGKLENGHVVQVQSALVKRLKHHFCALSCGVNVVLGINGFIWITAGKSMADSGANPDLQEDDLLPEEGDAERTRQIVEMESERMHHAQRVIGPQDRARIARVRNAVTILADAMRLITPQAIEDVFRASIQLALRADEMLVPENAAKLLA